MFDDDDEILDDTLDEDEEFLKHIEEKEKSVLFCILNKQGKSKWFFIGEDFTDEQIDFLEVISIVEEPSYVLRFVLWIEKVNNRFNLWLEKKFLNKR